MAGMKKVICKTCSKASIMSFSVFIGIKDGEECYSAQEAISCELMRECEINKTTVFECTGYDKGETSVVMSHLLCGSCHKQFSVDSNNLEVPSYCTYCGSNLKG